MYVETRFRRFGIDLHILIFQSKINMQKILDDSERLIIALKWFLEPYCMRNCVVECFGPVRLSDTQVYPV